MTKIQNYSIQDELLERFNNIVPPGQRSSVINKLISEYCDKYDGRAVEKKLKEHWLRSKVIPFVKQYAKNNRVDPYELWDSKGITPALKAAGIEATQEDIRSVIQILLKEDT